MICNSDAFCLRFLFNEFSCFGWLAQRPATRHRAFGFVGSMISLTRILLSMKSAEW